MKPMIVCLFILFVLIISNANSIEKYDDLKVLAKSSIIPTGSLCNNSSNYHYIYGCTHRLNILFFSPSLPDNLIMEGPNQRVVQIIEILASLGHLITFSYFSNEYTPYDHNSSVHNLFEILGSKVTYLGPNTPYKGKLSDGTKNLLSNHISTVSPDLIIFYYSSFNHFHYKFIAQNVKSFSPRAKLIVFLEESILTPIEWLPIYIKLIERPKNSTKKSIRKFQKMISKENELYFLKTADVIFLNSNQKREILSFSNSNYFNKLKVLRYMHTSQKILIKYHKNKENIMQIIKSRRKTPPPPHGSRKNIVFIGTGNFETNYLGLLWFDRNIIRWLRDGIPGIICDVIGKNWLRMKHQFTNRHLFRFLGDLSIFQIASKLDTYIAYISPLQSTIYGNNFYPLLAFERGLPTVIHHKSAEGLCESCNSLHLQNPLDPFSAQDESTSKSIVNSHPFLIASSVNNYDYVEKIKLLKYDSYAWANYSRMAEEYMKSFWFCRYQAALDLDSYIKDAFAIS